MRPGSMLLAQQTLQSSWQQGLQSIDSPLTHANAMQQAMQILLLASRIKSPYADIFPDPRWMHCLIPILIYTK